MPTSDEYIAKLGIDLSDVDKAVTLVGHIGSAFPPVVRQAEALERALGKIGGGQSASGITTTAKATQQAGDAAQKAAQSQLPRLRYALYDVSNASAIAGAALVASGVAIEATTIKYEALFADVARTSKGLDQVDLGNLKNQLLDITTAIPVGFDKISEIATLGNQLNIPEQALASFTGTVAKFSAVTNATADSAGTSFGRLGATAWVD